MNNNRCVIVFILLVNLVFATNISFALNEYDGISNSFSNENELFVLEKEYQKFIDNNDTVSAISNLLKLGNRYSHRAQYAMAYNNFWNALLLSDAISDSVSQSMIYDEIGWLYSFYLRTEEALNYYNKSLELRKQLINSGKIKPVFLVSSYLSLATFYRESGNYNIGKQYVDSCYYVFYELDSSTNTDVYIKAELAYYYVNINKCWKAIPIIESIDDWFLENNESYLIILYKFLGDAYLGEDNHLKSEYYYNLALQYARNSSSHANYIPIIYKRLSTLYYMQGRYKEAYNNLDKSQQYEAFLFDSRSLNNRPLLEISDDFKKEKELRSNLIQKQKIEQLEHYKKVSFYENLVLIIIVVSLILFGVLWYRAFRLKHKTEREIEKKKREFEAISNRELLELKNRELALSALQLIEKDKSIDEIREKLLNAKEIPSKNEIKRVFKSLSVNHNQKWKDFEIRFLEVNRNFYSKLTSDYPKLTPGELKLCALIKLDFSSKEMASVLGSGVESIHTLRYRLRKKLGLERSDNLTLFLNSIG